MSAQKNDRENDMSPAAPRQQKAIKGFAAGLWMLLFLAVMIWLPPSAATTESSDPVSKIVDSRERILGLVENGRFRVVDPTISGPLELRLTTIQRQEARAVESGEVGLSGYEGDAIMVEGIRDSGWIYEARIVDRAGPILTRLVREMFERKSP
jgi:hypothetical protein